jgi:hypothetical protein
LGWLFCALAGLGGLALGVVSIRSLNQAAIQVTWSTASELDIAGYNLLRAESPQGPFTRINQQLIPPSDDPLTGGDYTYEDAGLMPGVTYYYLLEDLELSGAVNRHGPIAQTARNRSGLNLLLAGVLVLSAGFYAWILTRGTGETQPLRTAVKHPTEHTVRLSVAGLGLVIHCPDRTVAEGLRASYRDFPLDGSPDLCLGVTLTGRLRSSPLLDTGTAFKEDVLHFTAPGYQGSLDLRRGTGMLAISSAHPLEDLDYAVRVAYALLAFQAGGVMLHAAGIVRNGRAYLFIGHSGSGKTTISRLSNQDTVLNDDLVIVLPDVKSWRAYGTPFWNPSQVAPHPQDAPLGGLYRLVQAPVVKIEALRESQAVAELVANVPVIPQDPGRVKGLLGRLAAIHQVTPLKDLYFTPDDSFWELVAPSADLAGFQ